MLGKTNILRFSIFFLALATGTACFGAEPPKFSVDLTKALNERFDQRIQFSLKAHDELAFYFKAPEWKFRLPFYFGFSCGCSLGISGLTTPKFLFDDPIAPIIEAFQGCTRLRILTVETSEPVTTELLGIFSNDRYNGFLILERTETSDAFALCMVFRTVLSCLQIDEWILWEPDTSESVDKAIENFKPARYHPPSIVFEFEGKKWMRIEIFSKGLSAVIRTKDNWGAYTFDQLSADAIEARVKDLHALYENQPAAD